MDVNKLLEGKDAEYKSAFIDGAVWYKKYIIISKDTEDHFGSIKNDIDKLSDDIHSMQIKNKNI